MLTSFMWQFQKLKVSLKSDLLSIKRFFTRVVSHFFDGITLQILATKDTSRVATKIPYTQCTLVKESIHH